MKLLVGKIFTPGGPASFAVVTFTVSTACTAAPAYGALSSAGLSGTPPVFFAGGVAPS
jgi:hypothetical protein